MTGRREEEGEEEEVHKRRDSINKNKFIDKLLPLSTRAQHSKLRFERVPPPD
jgi:hypothetical protein